MAATMTTPQPSADYMASAINAKLDWLETRVGLDGKTAIAALRIASDGLSRIRVGEQPDIVRDETLQAIAEKLGVIDNESTYHLHPS